MQTPPLHKYSLNGVTERAVEFLVQLAKSMIFHAQLNWKVCCCSAIKHAIYIQNRLVTTALHFGSENSRPSSNVTLVTAFSDEMISLKKLHIFGCAAFPLIHRDARPIPSKLAANIDTNKIFIGFQSKSSLVLLNRKITKEFRSEDCEYKE